MELAGTYCTENWSPAQHASNRKRDEIGLTYGSLAWDTFIAPRCLHTPSSWMSDCSEISSWAPQFGILREAIIDFGCLSPQIWIMRIHLRRNSGNHVSGANNFDGFFKLSCTYLALRALINLNCPQTHPTDPCNKRQIYKGKKYWPG